MLTFCIPTLQTPTFFNHTISNMAYVDTPDTLPQSIRNVKVTPCIVAETPDPIVSTDHTQVVPAEWVGLQLAALLIVGDVELVVGVEAPAVDVEGVAGQGAGLVRTRLDVQRFELHGGRWVQFALHVRCLVVPALDMAQALFYDAGEVWTWTHLVREVCDCLLVYKVC